MSCCRRSGPCATHLAEDHPAGVAFSTIHCGDSIACAPNYAGRELVGAFTRAAIEVARNQLMKGKP